MCPCHIKIIEIVSVELLIGLKYYFRVLTCSQWKGENSGTITESTRIQKH